MRNFGKMGRWGNQCFQYAFLSLYAEEHGCQLQLPPWVGEDLLYARYQPIDCELPPYHEPVLQNSHLYQALPPDHDDVVNRDFVGYAQYHTSYFGKWKQRFLQLFRFGTMTVKNKGTYDTWVGVHLRRGDYGRLHFYITPVEWYLRCLEEVWPTLSRPRMFIATEDKSLVSEFSQYDPATAEDLGMSLYDQPLPNYNYLPRDLQEKDPSQMDFYPDFYLLTQCKVILAPNSTFSFVAAMLSPKCKFYRSHLPSQRFRQEDPWHAYPLQHDRVEDYPEIPGVRCESNPYW